ncbi:MAG TPA: response regulator [Verrucomicrobiae bacterium]|nr:response regulator [Verrucomicrobiae bacterium]
MSNEAALKSNLNRPRILLAEDSDDDAFFFERAIKKSGVQCSFARASNGKVATELLQQAAEASQPIDLVFLDLKMPVMSGFEVLEWLRSANLPRAPKVLVLSGSNDHGDRIRAVELGAADYIVKPIAAGDLQERIKPSSAASAEVGAHA